MNKSYQKQISILPAAALLAVGLMASVQASGQSLLTVECNVGFNANNFAGCSTPELQNYTPKAQKVYVSVIPKTGQIARFDAYLSIYKRTQGGSANPTRVVTRSFVNYNTNQLYTNYEYFGASGIYHAKAAVQSYNSNAERIRARLMNLSY